MAWYTIDPIFFTNQRPAGLTDSDISTNATRRIFIDEVFPQTDIAQGQTTVQNTLDIAYYPGDKGPYNANPNFGGEGPQEKWGGMMRSISSTNFEQANVEFIQFWVLDPFVDGDATGPGELVINLGNISEDILADGRKQYENGLPGVGSNDLVTPTVWGQVPSAQSLVYAFDAAEANRALQDIGLDGVDDAAEAGLGYNGPAEDPALDNYTYYLNREGGILERYLDVNNPQGNSPVAVTDTDRGNTTLPDVEDVDRDLTMNTINSYYEYRIPIRPGISVEDRYVTDIREGLTTTLPNNTQLNYRWIQYKIPLREFTEAIGGISDFRSISFMRMYLTGFQDPVVLRFATLDLVRGDWRVYTRSLQSDNDTPSDDLTTFDVNAVNVEENSARIPIPYVLPPGVFREQLNNNNTIVRQNEQSLSLVVSDLEPGDSRAVFKNVNIDVRQYERLKMFLHAEKIAASDPYLDGESAVAFLRIGTDFTENFYQLEVPMSFTAFSATTSEEIWPAINELDVALADLQKVKSEGISDQSLGQLVYYEIQDGDPVVVDEFAPREPGKVRIGIRGNPSLGSLRSAMVGIKNIDNIPLRTEIWFNELRLAGLDNKGGWAAVASMDANMADFANVSATGSTSTSGFGAINQKPNERLREDAVAYGVVTNVELGKLFPNRWNLQIPFNYGISEELITPEFDPVYDDLKLQDRIDAADTAREADEIREQAEDYTKRTSINFIGVRKNRSEEKEAKVYDIENFTFNYSYNETNHRDFEVASLRDQNVRAGAIYNHAFKPSNIAPLAQKDSILRGSYWQWLKDFNFNWLPSNIAVQSDINRQFNQQRFRDVLEPGVERLELPLLQQRNYLFNWQYTLNYALSKSLRINLTASNNRIVRNYYEEQGNPFSEIDPDLAVWDGFFSTGEPNRHAQHMQLNYEIPFSTIPILDFIGAQYTYTSNFEWLRGGDALNLAVAKEQNPGVPEDELVLTSINTVQNANTHSLTATLNMQQLYDRLGLKKVTGKPTNQIAPPRTDKAGNPREGEAAKAPEKTSKLANTAIDILTMVKRVNVNYSENNGTVLPGYTRSVGFIGTTKPTFGFVFGSQADVRFEAARNGWLTDFREFNQQFIRSTNKQLNITATALPVPELTIDLIADRQYSSSLRENFRVEDGEYNPLATNVFGNFSISTIMIGTALGKSDEFDSESFDTFRENRIVIANRLQQRSPYGDQGVDSEGFPNLYGKTSQDVLLPAFYAAYTGKDAEKVSLDAFRDIPLPNWNIKYTGLMKNPWFRKMFKRFSLSHGYRAAYSINSFQPNLERVQLEKDLNDPAIPPTNPENGDLLPEDIYTNVVLNDQFNPLVRVDFEMMNSLSVLAEVRTDRALSLSLDNNLLTEINGKEYTLGLGYRISDVQFVTRIAGERQRLKGDLNLKADVSLRDNITIIRNLDVQNNQITSGQNLLSIKFTADYALTKNLNALFFYDHSFSQFAVSTAFPQTIINAGFTLRYNFGN